MNPTHKASAKQEPTNSRGLSLILILSLLILISASLLSLFQSNPKSNSSSEPDSFSRSDCASFKSSPSSIQSKLSYLNSTANWAFSESFDTDSIKEMIFFQDCEYLLITTEESTQLWKVKHQKMLKSLKVAQLVKFSMYEDFFVYVYDDFKINRFTMNGFEDKELTSYRGKIQQLLLSQDDRFCVFLFEFNGKQGITYREVLLGGTRKKYIREVVGAITHVKVYDKYLVFADEEGVKVVDLDKNSLEGNFKAIEEAEDFIEIRKQEVILDNEF